jgi:hypothetical protein
VVECLLGKCKALNSNPSTRGEKRKKKKKKIKASEKLEEVPEK